MISKKVGFIVREHGLKGFITGKSHIWYGDDTACKMWSTGGLNQKKRYSYYTSPPSEICSMCKTNHMKHDVDVLDSLFPLKEAYHEGYLQVAQS